ncbi:MAG: 6-carboxytetrahydropterin synthase [Methanoregulaceae archaeon]|nr:6-carboxytetrahydropterin synthase [Methanoregulaceae archaeon]
MTSRIYKRAHFDASHRLLHYQGKCANLHGHRWLVEVWIEGTVDSITGILVDYNKIREVVDRFDHQIILNKDDPMVTCISQFQEVITTRGDPTSELLAVIIRDQINDLCRESGVDARVKRIRVWESDTCYAEMAHDDR